MPLISQSYDGEYVIAPDSLSPMDTTAIALPYGLNAKTAIQKYRDLLKLYAAMQDGQAIYLFWGWNCRHAFITRCPFAGCCKMP